MWPYFALFFIPVMVASLSSIYEKKENTKLVLTSFFLIWLLMLLLRNESIGIDLANYSILFQNASQISWTEVLSINFFLQKDPGFYIISKIIQLFSCEFRFVISIFAVGAVIPLWVFYIEEINGHSILAMVLFLNIGVFSFYFSGLRQLLAMSVGFLSYYFVKKEKIIPFILTVIAAIVFHKSAFILFLMYPVYHMRIFKKQTLLFGAPLIVAVYLFRTPIFEFLGTFINDFYNSNMTNTGAISMFILFLLFFLYTCIIPDQSVMDAETISLRNILLMICIIQIFAGVHSIAMRMNYYFLPYIPVLLTRVIDCSKRKYKNLVKISMIVLVCYFTVSFFDSAYNGKDALHIFPYEFMWE